MKIALPMTDFLAIPSNDYLDYLQNYHLGDECASWYICSDTWRVNNCDGLLGCLCWIYVALYSPSFRSFLPSLTSDLGFH